MGAVDYFLKIENPNVEGETQDAKHAGEIEIEDWSWGESQTGTSAYGSGAGAGRVSMQDFRFTKRVDKSSPKLMLLCSNGQHLGKVTLTARKAGGDQLEYLKIIFEEAMISNYTTSGSATTDIVPREQIAFNYSKVKFEYREQKADGSLGGTIPAGWDIKRNVGF